MVVNNLGLLTSKVAVVTVFAEGEVASLLESGLVAWWPAANVGRGVDLA